MSGPLDPDALDELDRKVLRLLAPNGRMSWSDLASELGLSAPAAAERVRKLEQRGFIQGYLAQLDPARLGIGVTAFIAVQLDHPRHKAAFLKRVRALDAVMECHHVAGADDYLLKVRVGSLAELEGLITDGLKGVDGVADTRTTIALSTLKETSIPPLDGMERRERR
jgi:Lrp/AsnC family leucine-responsive transcriptional regulator